MSSTTDRLFPEILIDTHLNQNARFRQTEQQSRTQIETAFLRLGIPMATEDHMAVTTGRRRRTRSVSPSVSPSRHKSRSRSPLKDYEVCGNTKCRGNHSLRSCNGPPSPFGDIFGCPLCNTEEHDFDYCDKARRLRIIDLWKWLCVDRENKPPIRSSINVLTIAAYMKRCDYLPMTKSYSLQTGKPHGEILTYRQTLPTLFLLLARTGLISRMNCATPPHVLLA